MAEEIERVVLDAARDARLMRAGDLALRPSDTYRNTGMTVEEIVNEIITTAAKEGVAVEMSRPGSSLGRRSSGDRPFACAR